MLVVDSASARTSNTQHTRGDLNFDRGYEYWLMAEAKRRNPRVTTCVVRWDRTEWHVNVHTMHAVHVPLFQNWLLSADIRSTLCRSCVLE